MTRIDLSNTWSETLIFTVVLTVLFVRPSVSTLRTCWSDIQEKGLRIGASMSLWRLRWFFVGALLCFAASHLFTVSSNRTFDSVTLTDTDLLIDYAWPRHDFAVSWNEVQEARVDAKQFKGRRAGRRNRLRIETPQGRHVTLWLTGGKALQAQRLIEARTIHHKEQSNNPPSFSPP